jgi:NAD(P)H-nitrite reductase large subunit
VADVARRHLLLGGGPATIAAAEAIRAADQSAEITIVSDDTGYYSRPGLAYLLAREVPEARLFPFTPTDFAALRVTRIEAHAQRLDPERHEVLLDDGRPLVYDRLLLATGSRAVPAHAPGADLDGVVKLDDLADARDIIRRSAASKGAVVIGGGITALEIVEGLRAHRVPVVYLMRQDRYWRNVLSATESALVEEELGRSGVQVRSFTEVGRIVGRDGRVVAVEIGDGETISCDLVAVAIGVRPRVDLAREAGLDCARGVLVDDHLRTSDADVYAAGDIAETAQPGTGRRTLEVLWHSAVMKGRTAGRNMAGGPLAVYDPGVPLNITRLAGLRTTIIGTVGKGDDADLDGLQRGDSQTWSELGDATLVETRSDGARIRLALGARSIAGAVVIGDQSLSFPLQELIESRADVGAARASLAAPGADVPGIVDALWTEWGARGA